MASLNLKNVFFSSCECLSAPLSVYIQPERKVADLNQPASFHCVTSGVPISSLTWLKNGRPLTEDKGYRHMKDVLQFSSVSREDQGLYQCLISSETDSAQATAELKLGGKPTLSLLKI